MSSLTLCKLPPPSAGGCCAPVARLPAAPIIPVNPPGLSAIQYRIGTFTSFRRAMLDEVARPNLLRSALNPFKGWHEGTDGDYHTLLIELWAYLADILTFYQERIANEAYLGTATQRDSLMRIAELIGYRPAPGSGASGFAAFTVEKGKKLVVPAGLRVGSKAQPGKPAAVFETEAALEALGDASAIRLSLVAPTNQFAPLASFGAFFGGAASSLAQVASAAFNLYGSAGAIYASTFAPIGAVAGTSTASMSSASAAFVTGASAGPSPSASAGASHGVSASASPGVSFTSSAAAPSGAIPRASTRAESGASARASSGSISAGLTSAMVSTSPTTMIGADIADIILVENATVGAGLLFPYIPFINTTTRTIVLKGINTRLAPGDYLVVVENETPTSGKASARKVVSVTADKTRSVTTIRWIEPVDTTYNTSAKPRVYALRVKAGPFGNVAPNWFTLPTALTDPNGPNAPFKNKNWDDPPAANDWKYVPTPGEANTLLYLDATYDEVKGTRENPGWAVLLTDSTDTANPATETLRVVDVRELSRAAYSLNTKATRLEFDRAIPARTFPLRNTLVLTGSERIELEDNLPLPEPITGDKLILEGIHRTLKAGQSVIFRGTIYDPANPTAEPVINSELRSLKEAPVVDDEHNITSVLLNKSLDRQYTRQAGASLLANVVETTQGETVKDEVLGSSDGSAFQSFRLKKSPLTYLPSSDPEGLAAVESTLLVTANGVSWSEVPTLVESPTDAQVFAVSQDNAGQASVSFGDGITGARPPSGRDNIRARYRKGLGTSGNLGVDRIQQLIDNIPGLQKVTNPLPTGGGADAEPPEQIRANAPDALRAFGRAVSASDYAALALSFPGIAKASAAWITRDASLRALTHPYVQLTVGTADQIPLSQQPALAGKLRSYLDQRRDPNVTLRIIDFTPVFIEARVTVDIDDRFPRQATLANAQAALNPGVNPDASAGLFSFNRLEFGQSVHLSALYAALHAVPGVRSATVTVLRRLPLSAAAEDVADSIFVLPTELATIRNNPSKPNEGVLVVALGSGGFVDQ